MTPVNASITPHHSLLLLCLFPLPLWGVAGQKPAFKANFSSFFLLNTFFFSFWCSQAYCSEAFVQVFNNANSTYTASLLTSSPPVDHHSHYACSRMSPIHCPRYMAMRRHTLFVLLIWESRLNSIVKAKCCWLCLAQFSSRYINNECDKRCALSLYTARFISPA